MSSSPTLHPTGRPTRGGFSFIEVLFAVMILGIGFILIAGVFPVALSQTAASQEESSAATIARSAAATLSQIPRSRQLFVRSATDTGMAPPEKAEAGSWPRAFRFQEDFLAGYDVGTTTTDKFALIRADVINQNDPRYAWIAMVMRYRDPSGQPASTAQAIVVPVKARNTSTFSFPDLQQNLVPVPVTVTLIEGNANPDQVRITGARATAAAPGAVIVLVGGKSGDPTVPVNDNSGRPVAGRSYRLGNLVSGGGANVTYELAPGGDMSVFPGKVGAGTTNTQEVSNTPAFLVGQQLLDPAGSDYGGGSMVLGVYTMTIPLND